MERLAGFDAAFLALESATNHMHVASLLIVDPRGVEGAWSADHVRELVRRRLPLVPPFRRQLVRVPFGINHPLWTDVVDVDLGVHIRRAALPSPGGPQELAEVVGDLMGRPLDRTRPLWELHVVEGLADGRMAVMIKAHHSALDGISGTELLAKLLDTEPVVPEEAVLSGDEAAVPEQADEPSEAQIVGDAVAGLPGTDRLMAALQRTVATVLSLRHRNATSDAPPPPSAFSAPRTSLNVRIGPWRRVGWARLPLEEMKSVTAALGGTTNDVVLALCSSALATYFADRDEKPDGDLVALVPVSVRSARDPSPPGNRISPMLVSLATQVEGSAARLIAISAGTARARSKERMIHPDLLPEWADIFVPALAVPAARLGSRLLSSGPLPPLFNVIVSNVPGPKTPLFLAGAEVTAVYPLGPVLDSVALNVTVMKYQDHIHVGLVADRDAVRDLGALITAINAALEELVDEVESRVQR